MKKHLASLLACGLTLISATPLMATNLTPATTLLSQYQSNNMNILSQDEATALILEQIGDATVQNMYLDAEDGCLVYEVNLVKDSTLYDVEIDARTGIIYQIEADGIAQIVPVASTGLDAVKITWQQARTIATERIGGGTPTKVELEKEDGRMVYEVEVLKDNVEHEFEIDANTGAILKHNREIINASLNTTDQNAGNQEATVNQNVTSSNITKEQASKIALEKVGGGVIKKAKLDREDGRLVYEVKVLYNNEEHEFEIDAKTGTILKQDSEYRAVQTMATLEVATSTTKSTKAKTASQLSREEVKKIAYEQVPEGTIVKMDMDYEHGKLVYEIKMRKGAAEYDLEMDATTGTVYKCEVDY